MPPPPPLPKCTKAPPTCLHSSLAIWGSPRKLITSGTPLCLFPENMERRSLCCSKKKTVQYSLASFFYSDLHVHAGKTAALEKLFRTRRGFLLIMKCVACSSTLFFARLASFSEAVSIQTEGKERRKRTDALTKKRKRV